MLPIIQKEPDFIVVNKPSGILVHPVRGGAFEGTVVGELIHDYPEIKNVGDKPDERPGIVHRLDKDTSGVLLVCRTQTFFEFMKAQFQAHTIQKTYLALVHGRPSRVGKVDKPIGLRSGTTKRSVSARNMKMVKPALTEYETLESYAIGEEMYSFVQLIPRTGRTHQLRVHMAAIGCPVVGDPLYGREKNVWNLKRQFLHAASLGFDMPNGEHVKIEAELPQELMVVVEDLRKNFEKVGPAS